MSKIRVGFMRMGLSSFDIKRGREIGERSVNLLKDLGVEVIDRETLDLPAVKEMTKAFKMENIDLLVIQHETFSRGNFSPEILRELSVPLIMWAIPEPLLNGSPYKCGSLVGLIMHSSIIRKMDRDFEFIFGLPEEDRVKKTLKNFFKVIETIKRFKESRIGFFGYRPPGFYGSTFDELKIKILFGSEIIHFDLSRILKEFEKVSPIETKKNLEKILKKVKVKCLRKEELVSNSKLYLATRRIIDENGLDGVAIKCWPEIRDEYEKGVCFVNSRLNDEGIMAVCEADIYGLLTMMSENFLTGKVPFFADLVSLNKNNIALFWHCGAAPLSLAGSSKPEISQYYRGKGGVATNFPLKEGKKVTIVRLSYDKEGYKMFISSGEALKTEMILMGNPLKVKLKEDGDNFLSAILDEGIEQHFSLIYEDIRENLVKFCNLKGIRPILI